MAQQVTIPGYAPTPAVTPVTTPITPKKNNSSAVVKKPNPVPATQDELRALMESVDLSQWGTMPSYLWTCTPSYIDVPMYSAKTKMQKAFDEFKKENKVLTKEKAAQIAALLGKPATYRIVGLYADFCRLKIAVLNVKKPYGLNCLFIILEVRQLAQLATLVAENTGKAQPLPPETFNAIQNLLDSRCLKENITAIENN